jgi:cell division transport system permease protein
MAVTRNTDATRPVKKTSPGMAWLMRHVSTAIGSLGRLARQPFASLMTILVIAVTLALPASLHLVIKNAEVISGGWEGALDFSVYLKDNVSLAKAQALANIIDQRADVELVTLISADEALREFKTESGFGDALDHLSSNPLPHTLMVRPSDNNSDESISLLREELGNLPETDVVQMDTEWVQRFHAILDILQRAGTMAAALLGAAVIVIIGNTIRLDIQNRREEIEVTKLIGASNAFIRRPFLYSGFWYGLGGGLLALALVYYGLSALEVPVSKLAGLYGNRYNLISLNFRECLFIAGIGVFLGLAGSWTAATRHMRRIEPR